MQCSACRHEAVIFQPYSGRYLCRDHFFESVESRAKREIRKCQGVRPGDHIGVVQDGNLPARVLLTFLEDLTRGRKNIRVSAACAGSCPDPSITRMALAVTLEDAAATVLASLLEGYRGQPVTACRDAGPCSLPQFAPFAHIPEEEIVLYGRFLGIAGEAGSPQDPDPFVCEVKSLLADYTGKHPAAPYAVLNLGGELDRIRCTWPGVDRHGA